MMNTEFEAFDFMRALMLLVVIIGSTQPAAAQDGNAIIITVRTDSAAYELGQPVEITIEKCNPTAQPITVAHSSPCGSFTLEVLDRFGDITSYYSCGGPGIGLDVTWLSGECHSSSFTWPQTSIFFTGMGQGGPQVPSGFYRVRYLWHPNLDVDTVASSQFFSLGIAPVPVLSWPGQILFAVLIVGMGVALVRSWYLGMREFKFEVRHFWPNTSFQRTRVRSGRGLGPLNSKRWRGAARHANGTGVDERPATGAQRRPTGRSSGPSPPRVARKRAPLRQLGRSTPVPLGKPACERDIL